MLHDILEEDHIQWHPPLIRHYTNSWPCHWSGRYYRIWLYQVALGFHPYPFASDDWRNPIDFWSWVRMSRSNFVTLYMKPFRQDAGYSHLQSLSNHFQTSHKLLMTRGGIGALCANGHTEVRWDNVRWREEGPYLYVWVTESKVKITLVTLSIKHWGHDTGNICFAQSLLNFTHKLWVIRGGSLLIFGDRVKFCTVCRLQLNSNIQTYITHISWRWWEESHYLCHY